MTTRRTILTEPQTFVEPVVGDGLSSPRQYRYATNAAAQKLFGREAAPMLLRRALVDQSPVFTWSPSLKLILFAPFVPVNLLLFGLPRRTGKALRDAIAQLKFRLLLRLSTRLFVIEPLTAADVKRLSGREAVILPLPIDTDFFEFQPEFSKRNDILMVGNNGRDEQLGDELARAGVPLVRVTNDQDVRDYHLAQPPGGVRIAFDLSYPDLRETYRRARLVIVPLRDFNHEAGMTATFEAMACGAPVAISDSRAGSFLHQFPSVFLVNSRSTSEWLATIASALEISASNPDLTIATSDLIKRQHPDLIAQLIASALVD